jgi:DNA modification methylase
MMCGLSDYLDKIILGDFRDVLKNIPDDSIDMVITDPPYPKKYSYVWEPLFEESARVLKPRGNFISLCGHYQLPLVLSTGEKYLRYWWILWMKQSRLNRLIGKGVAVLGKPAVWFLKERRRDFRVYKFPIDTITSSLSEDKFAKEYHKWGQSVNWFAHYIGELTLPGEVVLDPMCGSGSSIIACKLLDRHFIGVDNDPHAVETTRQRLDSEVLHVVEMAC